MARAGPSFMKDLGWRVEALGFDLFTAVFRLLPVDTASAIGGALMRRFGPLTSAHRTAAMNLRLAFPEKDDAWRARVLDAQWDNTGRTFAEFSLMDRLRPSTGRVEVVNGERLREIARSGRAVVLVSGHWANWEVMAAAIVESGIVCLVTYRAANNPYVDQRIKSGRFRYGVRLFAPKGGEGARDLLDAMGRGESVALMNDQKFNQGVLAPFFDRPVHTAPGPTRLALRFGTVIQPLSVQRLDGARFRVVVHEPMELESTGDRSADIEAGVRRITRFVEDRVRERPEEWFWSHRRWPNEAYAELQA